MEKVIVAGSRTINNYDTVKEILKLHFGEGDNVEVVQGGARGVDRFAEQYATENNLKYMTFKPAWDVYGKSAGPIRNRQMAEYGDVLIAIWDGASRGTKNMIDVAEDEGIEVFVYVI